MKRLFVLFFLLCAAHYSYSQTATVKGTIVDTLNQLHLSNAVIMLLHAQDSTLYKFGRSDESGKFSIPELKEGKYVLVVSYPTFADYADTLSLSANAVKQLGNIALIQKSKLLNEVVVQQKIAAIKMKGDTTEYNAASFKTRENASVEELLKILPGIEVNAKGEIKAQGESVQKVLVDGEEFFGDDPTLVTKNLKANMVDKVQLYDKKSDQAAFTGVDDGQRSKTINIQLKEDSKKGYFGKVALGYGTEGYHDNQVMFNYFKGKKKISAYGIFSSTGKVGLNWQDKDKYGLGTDEFSINEDGDFDFMWRGDELDSWDGRYNGNGYPTVQTGGVHYNDKWDRDRQRVNTNYKLMNLSVKGSDANNSQTLLGNDSTYYNESTGDFKNHIFRNRIDGDYEWQYDSSSSFRVMVDGTLDHKNSTNYNTSSTRLNDEMKNSGTRMTTNIADIGSLNSNIFWRKKFKKPRRTMSFNFSENYQQNKGAGNVDATTTFYRPGLPDSVKILDQYKVSNSDMLNLVGNLTYTEPISKNGTITATYGFNWLNSNSNRLSYNDSGNGKYTDLDSLYSNDYNVTSFTNKVGLSYGYTKDKIRISFGGSAGLSDFTQEDQFRNHTYNRQFVNYYPRAVFRYNFSQYRRFSFTYNGNTEQPRIDALQPLVVNDNPLFITIGNPDLKPSFNNRFNASFNDYKVLSKRSIWVSLGYNFILNSFGNRSVIDKGGVTTSQTVNINGNQTGWFNFSFNWETPIWDLRIGPGGRMNYTKNLNYTQGILVNTHTYNPGLNISVSKYEEKKYEFYLRFDANYNASVSSLKTNVQPNYWNYYIEGSSTIMFPAKIDLRTELEYNLRQRTSVFTSNNNVAIVNASLTKRIGKKDDIIFGVSVNDLLNQNVGITRSIYSNNISESRRTTIQRYFLLTFSWNFSKFGGSTAANEENK
ncbi:hypothetical protein J2T02_005072 [Chitinophaga terrae (ex Kim and Jung 2007)]|uniref:outer membrane beta-barrel protein n=1 Tax=Chitinophaga terrae (ex Kim and Jung 2007) TaxID=408074 RepID=UPI002784051E|nr:outer membrane beta-barrel protein [Chitinophaga terrae (ex Kim and Jung 2007)]MDQ0109927.1 hypothetical protein [Chitinophaga terrae (ex Kim and Jung 2007)]